MRTESAYTAEVVSNWASANGFDASPTSVFLGHGGVEFFDLALTRIEVPTVSEIQEQGRLVRSGLQAMDDAHYTTWVGAIN